MSKILVLAPSGFGKTTSVAKIDKIGHIGLNPEETFLITATSKDLPFRDCNRQYTLFDKNTFKGNRYISNDGRQVALVTRVVLEKRPEIKNIVIDDANYIMQDEYMQKAMSKGYDIFKEIGSKFYQVFEAMEMSSKVNFIMMAHYEEYRDSNLDTLSYRFKTVGKMVQDYITPEGKFNIVLFGKQFYDEDTKQIKKMFVTNYDGQYPAKSPIDMFEELYIPNDLGLVVKKIEEFNG